ncbi:class E sortase [Nocardioides sp. 503]|uniref:sortase n=1 Tax=Nocardioides sp. 503 TaxID=2508326 RepID=UPI00106F2D77|nr:class E sortase [Nocardioides sp. 503]
MSALLDPGPTTVLRVEAVDSSPPPGVDRERLRIGASQVLMGLSLVLVWALLYLFVLSGLEQAHAQSALYGRLRTELAEGTAPTGAPIALGSPVALISIPGAGVKDLVVVEGSRPTQLQDGPGHMLGSVLPGQQGVSVVAGHSLSFGGPFSRIDGLTRGSLIKVTTAQGSFAFEVLGVRTKGDPVPAALAAGAARLTLVTAGRGLGPAGDDVEVPDALKSGEPAARSVLDNLAASDSVFVDAELAAGVPAGPVATADPDAKLMTVSADTTTLALLALALQLLVGALVAFAWAWTRWSRPAAWIALGPGVLATLWLASSIGSRLLPGLV